MTRIGRIFTVFLFVFIRVNPLKPDLIRVPMGLDFLVGSGLDS
jgi:hypothetical protein